MSVHKIDVGTRIHDDPIIVVNGKSLSARATRIEHHKTRFDSSHNGSGLAHEITTAKTLAHYRIIWRIIATPATQTGSHYAKGIHAGVRKTVFSKDKFIDISNQLEMNFRSIKSMPLTMNIRSPMREPISYSQQHGLCF